MIFVAQTYKAQSVIYVYSSILNKASVPLPNFIQLDGLKLVNVI